MSGAFRLTGIACTFCAVNYWLGSGSSPQQFRYVNNNGNFNTNNASNGNNWQRPAMARLLKAAMGGDSLIKRFNAISSLEGGLSWT